MCLQVHVLEMQFLAGTPGLGKRTGDRAWDADIKRPGNWFEPVLGAGGDSVYSIVKPRNYGSCLVDKFRVYPLDYKYEECVQISFFGSE